MRAASLFFAALVASGVTGCSGDDPKKPAPTPTPSPTVDTQPASPTAAVRFKGNEVISNDLSRGLSLEATAICNELGAYSCTDKVHKVTLGGVDPYDRQIYEPFRSTVATTSLAAERVVLSACLERANRDFADGATPAIFAGLPVDAGKLTDRHADAVRAAIDALYVKLVQRHASKGEIAALEEHYLAVEASGDATPAKTWAGLACFSVGTSTEFLFY